MTCISEVRFEQSRKEIKIGRSYKRALHFIHSRLPLHDRLIDRPTIIGCVPYLAGRANSSLHNFLSTFPGVLDSQLLESQLKVSHETQFGSLPLY